MSASGIFAGAVLQEDMMKRTWMMMVVLMSAMSAGAVTRESVQKEAAEAGDAAVAYARESKEEFTRQMRANLTSVEEDIADLKSRASVAATDARVKLNKEIEALEDKRDTMKKRLDRFNSSSDRAWTRMRSGLEKAWSEVKVAYKKASREFDKELDDEAESSQR
ncbi:MAG: hypothetical protein NDI61_10465 [Bdellovibrionaceae bacterium]|nr:hypothetical protein [Pseudobdellovibrionaceae bacterium]